MSYALEPSTDGESKIMGIAVSAPPIVGIGRKSLWDDDTYFENLTRCIFQAGFNLKTFAEKQSSFRTAFHDFVSKVASYDDET